MYDNDLAAQLEPRPQTPGGVVAPGHDDVGAPRGRADHAAEIDDLRAFVPLGMVEEGEVVHRHDGRHRRPQGHRVVGTVPDVGANGARDPRSGHLLPRQSRGSRIRRERVQIGFGRELLPPNRVVAPGEQMQIDVAARRHSARDGDGVHTRADRTGGNGRNVEQHAHRAESTENSGRERERRRGCDPRRSASS